MRQLILWVVVALLLGACTAPATSTPDTSSAATPEIALPSVTPEAPAPTATPETAATATSGTADPATPAAPAADLSDAVLVMQRTPCFGLCPYYTVTLDADGTVTWLGEGNVKVMGDATSTADPAAVQALIQSFLDAGFMDMNEEYREVCDANGECYTVADLPGVQFTLTVEGKEKVVRNYAGGPEILTELAAQVDALANTEQWVGPQP